MKYIASWSGGKDSTASIILAHEMGEPLDFIIFSEVMFASNISGELPEHIEFIQNAIPLFKEWGYEVKILRNDKNYLDIFYREPSRGKRAGSGLMTGFPMIGKCQVNRDLKIKPIKQFRKAVEEEITEYIGIAIDEPKRLERLGKNQISLLEKYEYTEEMAYRLCKRYDLLSPIYSFSKRGGCWFCPNARYKELSHLRTNHPKLWKKLLELEEIPNLIGKQWNSLEKIRIHDWEERFYWEDRQMSIFDFI